MRTATSCQIVLAAILLNLILLTAAPAQNLTTSSYQYLTEFERTIFNDVIKFWYLDTLQGCVHSNDTIWFQGLNGQPIFLDTISTSAPVFRYIDGGNPFFAVPPVMNAPRVALPQRADSIRELAAETGHFYSDNNGTLAHRLVFSSGGWIMTAWPLGYPYQGRTVGVYEGISNQQAIFVDGYLELKGLVHGTVTVGAHGSNNPSATGYHCIKLLDDIRYWNSDSLTGQFNASDRDMLQIVSESDVVIGNTPANGMDNCGMPPNQWNQAPMSRKSIIITATVVALGEAFTFEDQNDSFQWEYSTGYEGPTPDHRGNIILRGSLAQYRRGYVHRSNHGDTGYGKRFFYDSRLNTRWLPGIKARHIPVFQPPQLNFGRVSINEADTLALQLRDEGGTYIDVQTAHTGTPAFSVLPVDSTTLSPGENCMFYVIFQPNQVIQYRDTLTVELYYGTDLKVLIGGAGMAGTVSGVSPEKLPVGYVLQIYPNPFNGQLRIDLGGGEGPTDLAIYDINGRIVAAARPAGRTYTWEPKGLAGGIYFVTLRTPQHTICRKVVYLR